MSRGSMLGVAALAAATLLLESTLTRLLAVAQFYHFAFLAVSLALLGFGASGTTLSLAARRRGALLRPERWLSWSGLGFAAGVGLAYAAVNLLPFDSYSIAWERRQILYFVLYYLALTLPFFCAGLGIGAALAGAAGRGHRIYAANLLGSAAGVLLAPALLWLAGVPGAVLASALIGLAVFRTDAHAGRGATARGKMSRFGGFSRFGGRRQKPADPERRLRTASRPERRAVFRTALLVGLACLIALTLLNLGERAPLGMAISPYKGLAHARRYPGSQLVFGRWDAIARVDVVAGAGMRALPGLSYAYKSTPPPQLGLALDADALQPITLVAPGDFDAAAFLPEALAFELRPAGRVLVLASGGGLGVLQALAAGAQEATAVLEEPLARRAVAVTAAAHDPFAHPAVRTADEPSRVVLRRTQESYDVVYLPLTVPYRPVTSGAYSLAETYGLTREMFEDALGRLAPAGVLAVTRWLQTPPSESVRLMATLIEALERRGVSRPADALVAYRGIQTITVLARPDGWPAEDLEQVRQFTESRRYDLVWAPDVRPDELNRFNRLPAVADHEATVELLDAAQRSEFYRRYPYAVAPATDDRPFFFHFFRWGQTRQTLALLGRTWQPFGGSGYFVLFALLALALVLSIGLIVAPLAVSRTVAHATASAAGDETGHVPGTSEVPGTWGETRSISRPLLYFGLLGVAFLFVEIPLIQRWILAFGHATYAFAVVVFAVLVGAGAGSLAAHASWLPRRAVFPALIFLIVLTILGGPQLVRIALGWPLAGRVALAVASLAPLAFLMGLPFPLGLAWAEARRPAAASLIPWAWAVNGCASVIAAVLAAILALSFGFTAVLWLGAIGYAAAGVILTKSL